MSVGIGIIITMKFGTLLVIITFCAGAAFTLVDIGSDSALAVKYWNGRNSALGDYHYAILTTTWIGLGGVSQLILVIYWLFRRVDRLDILPKVTRIGLFLATTVLMGPVVINLYGALYVFRNRNKEHVQESVKRYICSLLFRCIHASL